MICRIRYTGVYLPLGSAPASVSRRALVRCQTSNSANVYSTLEKSELKKELQTRGLSISGGREQLIHRLHLSDAPPPLPVATLPNTTATAAEATTPLVAETEIKEEEPASGKKPRAVRKKKAKTPVLTSNGDTVLASSPSDMITEQPEGAGPAEQQLNETTLVKLAKGELQAMAVARGLAKSGTKAQIAARILELELGAGIGAASVEITPAVAAPKQRAPRKKTTILKKTSTDDEIELFQSITTTSKSIKPFTPPPPLRLSESAALKRDAALAAAVTVTAALNSKRRVLAMMEEAIAVAVTTTAAQNVKWQQEEKEKGQQAQKVEKKKMTSSSLSSSEPSTPPVPVSERRRLSPDEAAKVLEEVVRRKGTGGVGLGTGRGGDGDGSGTAGVIVAGAGKQAEVFSEVDSMKTVMAGLKARLNAQEENTEQLRASMQKNSCKSAGAAGDVGDVVQVQEEQKVVGKVAVDTGEKAVFMVDKQQEQTTTASPTTITAKASSTTSTSTAAAAAAAAVSDDTQLQSAIDFALTLRKAVTVVGRGLFNSIMKKTK
ncbi:hypothetical protein Ndes2526A_g02332 [Nannochloris sp. 'desiccata']